MAILKKRKILSYGVETTAGTAASTLSTLFCYEPMAQGDVPQSKRAATGVLGQLTAVPGGYAGKLTCSFDLAGSGTSGSPSPAWAPLLAFCGYQNTSGAIWAPTSNVTNYKTGTFTVDNQGPSNAVRKQLIGAMGKFSIEGEAGKAGSIKFEFTGIWSAVTDHAYPALPAFAPTPPRFVSSAFAIGSYTPKIDKLSLDCGNTVTLIPSIATASGYAYAIVTDRDPTGSIDPEQENVATWDPYGEWLGPTPQAFNVSIGSVAGNIVTITAPAMQFTDVQEADRSDLVTSDIKYQLNQSAGDDECLITFS